MSDLNGQLIRACAAGDHSALVRLYQQAAREAPDAETTAFFLTQAYVFALEQGHPDAARLRQKLVAAGKEEPGADMTEDVCASVALRPG